MATSDRRLERLLVLVATLLDTSRPLRREEVFDRMAEHYAGDAETKRRAFERDKEVLRAIGIPLDIVERPGAGTPEIGYRIRPDVYELPDPGLAPDELAAIRLAVAMVEAPGAHEATEALWKLAGPRRGLSDDGASDNPVITATVAEHPAVVPLFGAVVERRRVRFAYGGQAREVDPWRLTSERGHWYLQGYDHGRQGERLYRVDRIETRDGTAVVETIGPSQAFERPPTSSRTTLSPWLFGDEVETHARLLVDADHVDWVADAHGLVAEETRSDGSAIFVIPVANRSAFRSFVLGLLDHAVVLEPADLRAEIVTWLRAVP